jgi:UDP-N-acetylglucosamine 2-epimerase (non-hydrolysing)
MSERLVHVVGARPNFMKAGPVVRALEDLGLAQIIIHTGQHYDAGMSDVFFRDLDLPTPDVNLGVGSGTQAGQTAALLLALDEALDRLQPAILIVYGDVNSTLAAALVAAKRGITIAHVEAGLRSFDASMPEEINRRVTDLLSDLCFVTSPEAVDNLTREGVTADRILFVGNTMIDTLLSNEGRFDVAAARARLDLDGPYAVATIHRPANVDSPADARRVVEVLVAAASVATVVLPLHPRGRPSLEAAGLADGDRLRVIDPLGYIDFISLVRGASFVITDSGGIQEETTILGVPCLTLRPNTERPITISHGTNRLVTADEVVPLARAILDGTATFPTERPPLWDGRAGPRIAEVIAARLREASARPGSGFSGAPLDRHAGG